MIIFEWEQNTNNNQIVLAKWPPGVPEERMTDGKTCGNMAKILFEILLEIFG